MIQSILLVARYYSSEGYKAPRIERLLEEYILRCDSNTNLSFIRDIVEKAARRANKRKMIEIDYIPITQQELDEIGTLPYRGQKKVAFTMLCLAKYYNFVNPQNNGWVNREIRDIFKMATVALTLVKQDELLRSLVDQNFIQENKIMGKPNFKVLKIHRGDTILKITDFRNLGNQYLKYCGENFIECKNCGLVIKRRHYSNKYCKDCAIEVEKLRSR